MRLLCRVWGHRWSGPALVSSLDGHTTRHCGRCNTRVTMYVGARERYATYA